MMLVRIVDAVLERHGIRPETPKIEGPSAPPAPPLPVTHYRAKYSLSKLTWPRIVNGTTMTQWVRIHPFLGERATTAFCYFENEETALRTFPEARWQ